VPSESPPIEIRALTKRFRKVLAVDDLSFSVERGRITGFVGPNGAGKTTTLRAVLGLVAPTGGEALVFGRPYSALDDPIRQVGAVLETSTFHPGRSGRNHLRTIATATGIPRSRVEEVLALVGLAPSAKRRVGGYSLGMRQRLGLAAALLGDPQVLVLDEPANGLDPEGIRWLRTFLRELAEQGRTILVSSHVLAELAQTVDDVAIIAKGRLIAHAPVDELTARAGSATHVRSPQAAALQRLLAAAGIEASSAGEDALGVAAEPARVGELAAANGIVLHELRPESSSLEEIFLELTGGEEAAPG
jgi:ABC-2 type transport system ATP-binding protein